MDRSIGTVRYIVSTFFKTDRGDWQQPGNSVMFDEKEAEKYLTKGFIKKYQTRIVEPPETRVREIKKRGRKRKNENADLGNNR